MNVPQTHRRTFRLLLAGFLLCAATFASAKWEREQIQLETQLADRIEGILSKTLPPNSYLVTVKVEMTETAPGGVQRKTSTRGGENPFLQKNRFVLPGVPEKKQFNTTPEVQEENTVVNPPAESLVKKIMISIMVAPDIEADQIRSLRDLISTSIPFNPLRGDELDIKNSSLLKPTKAPIDVAAPAPAKPGETASSTGKWYDRNNLPFLILLGAVAVGLLGLAVFLFGPARVFFNRLLAVLPRVGEQAMYAANAAGNSNSNNATKLEGSLTGGAHGGTNNDTGPRLNMPFQFIREDQLNKLALMFRVLSSSEAALILAYLPPAWASRLLSSLDPITQAAITRELSKSREVPPEEVQFIEAQIREKLPYMVGGTEWIQAVFPLTQPQTQRVLLSTLAQDSPEMAQALRAKTFFYEDLGTLNTAALRLIVQELGYPQMALALTDERRELQIAVLGKLPAGIREIIQQELELAGKDPTMISEAKTRLVMISRRLLVDGRITLGGAV